MEKKRILIVEDDLILTMLNSRFVELLGHEVVKTLKSGEEAVDFALKNDLDLILMDVRLKGMIDGIEATEQINKVKPIPVIYITGNSDRETRSRAENTNMLNFCIKPINFEELESILGKAD
ncbi:MAG: response regulator [Flavobacteriia bacterium]|nr:response regulator [Flavobacteriia bacterium]